MVIVALFVVVGDRCQSFISSLLLSLLSASFIPLLIVIIIAVVVIATALFGLHFD